MVLRVIGCLVSAIKQTLCRLRSFDVSFAELALSYRMTEQYRAGQMVARTLNFSH